MKKRITVLVLVLVMLLQCGCALAPAETELIDKIVSSDDVTLAKATVGASTITLTADDMAYVRGGTWADKNWHKILEERKIDDGTIIIKNGLTSTNTTRLALFKYDVSGLSAEDIGFAEFGMSFDSLQNGMDVTFDIYWIDENWDEKTVTWNTKPAMVSSTPIISNVITTSVEKIDATDALLKLVNSGKNTVSLMVVQTVNTDTETRISFAKSIELDYPHFVIYKDANIKDQAYIKQLVDDEAENQAIWDYAKQMFDEWYERYFALLKTPLNEAELIVSDASQYNKTSYSTGANPTSAMKEYKTRTYGDLTDMSKYVDVTAEQKFDKYGGIIDEQMR